jgi:Fic family protein
MIVEAPVATAAKALRLLDALFKLPYVGVVDAAEFLNVSYPTANNLIAAFVRLGILREVTGNVRNRVFVYQPYLDLVR